MPATSKKQAIVAAIAEHSPDKLMARNKSILSMGKSDLSDFASTPQKGLPYQAPKKKAKFNV